MTEYELLLRLLIQIEKSAPWGALTQTSHSVFGR